MKSVNLFNLIRDAVSKSQGRIQKFLEGGSFEFFWLNGKMRGGFWVFFLKNSSKLKKIPKKS